MKLNLILIAASIVSCKPDQRQETETKATISTTNESVLLNNRAFPANPDPNKLFGEIGRGISRGTLDYSRAVSRLLKERSDNEENVAILPIFNSRAPVRASDRYPRVVAGIRHTPGADYEWLGVTYDPETKQTEAEAIMWSGSNGYHDFAVATSPTPSLAGKFQDAAYVCLGCHAPHSEKFENRFESTSKEYTFRIINVANERSALAPLDVYGIKEKYDGFTKLISKDPNAEAGLKELIVMFPTIERLYPESEKYFHFAFSDSKSEPVLSKQRSGHGFRRPFNNNLVDINIYPEPSKLDSFAKDKVRSPPKPGLAKERIQRTVIAYDRVCAVCHLAETDPINEGASEDGDIGRHLQLVGPANPIALEYALDIQLAHSRSRGMPLPWYAETMFEHRGYKGSQISNYFLDELAYGSGKTDTEAVENAKSLVRGINFPPNTKKQRIPMFCNQQVQCPNGEQDCIRKFACACSACDKVKPEEKFACMLDFCPLMAPTNYGQLTECQSSRRCDHREFFPE